MEYGLQASGTYDHVLSAATLAHDRGLAAFALPDHYLLALDEDEAKRRDAPDAFVQLGGLARETRDLDLVMLVSPITFRHPAVLVKMAVTLDAMSGGRFALGVGTGWMELEHDVFGFDYPDTTTRFEMLEDALAYISAAFDRAHPGHAGDYFQLREFPLAPTPERSVPIVVGGTGQHKTPRLAGRYADEFNVYPGPDMAERIARFRQAAEEANRDPETIRLSSSGQVIAAATEEEFSELMEERAEKAGMEREELEAYFEKRRTPLGTFEQVRAQLDGFAALGVERFYFQGVFAPGDTEALLDGLEV